MSGSLFSAVQRCDRWRVEFLLSRGISINAKDSRGENVLVSAMEIENARKRPKMFVWLLYKGAEVLTLSRSTSRHILHWAACLNRPAEAEIILREAGGELNLTWCDLQGYTALHYAAIHGSVDLVTILCRAMRKYDVSVDVIDADGLTPYLLAVRLGHRDCARVIQEDGLASKQRYDDKAFQSVHFWETVGQLERDRQKLRYEKDKVGVYKTFGRLPQLVASDFDTKNIRLIPTDNERKALKRNQRRHGRIDEDWNAASAKAEDQDSHLKPSNRKKKANLHLLSSAEDINLYLERDGFFDEPPSHIDSGEISSPKAVSSILGILSEEQTGAYLPSAKPPAGRGSIKFGSLAHVTTFGVKLKRKHEKKGKTSRAERNAIGESDSPSAADDSPRKRKSAGIDRDRLPVIISA